MAADRTRLQVEAYHQSGTRAGAPLSAFLVHGSADWTGGGTLRPGVVLWYDYLSGDTDPAAGTATTFDTMYGTNHKFYGHIDIAGFSQANTTDGLGLQDAATKLSVQPTDRVKLGVDLHALLPAVASDTPLLAVETDMYGKVAITDGLAVLGGANLWMPPAGPSAPERMGWLMVDAKL